MPIDSDQFVSRPNVTPSGPVIFWSHATAVALVQLGTPNAYDCSFRISGGGVDRNTIPAWAAGAGMMSSNFKFPRGVLITAIIMVMAAGVWALFGTTAPADPANRGVAASLGSPGAIEPAPEVHVMAARARELFAVPRLTDHSIYVLTSGDERALIVTSPEGRRDAAPPPAAPATTAALTIQDSDTEPTGR